MGKELFRDTVYLAYDYKDYLYRVGKLSRLLEDDGRTIYEFDFEPDRIDHVLSDSSVWFPGINITKGYFQRHDRLPNFMYVRTAPPNRTDIETVLARYGLTKYDRFELLKASGGRGPDNWRVCTSLEEMI